MPALLVGALAGVLLSMTTSYAITGWAFHRFQLETPATWRRESWRQHALAVVLYALAGLSIAAVFALAGAPPIGHRLVCLLASVAGAIACCLLVQAVYVHWHPLVVVGLILEWTVLVAGVVLACAYWAR